MSATKTTPKNNDLSKFIFCKAGEPQTTGAGQGRWSDHLHRLDAYDPDSGDYQGHMCWEPRTGELCDIFVDFNIRRQGIATTMWETANIIAITSSNVVTPKHSSTRSEDGDAWAWSVSGEIPELRELAHHYDQDLQR